jgi:DNA-binding MarR family transcriptional regulator
VAADAVRTELRASGVEALETLTAERLGDVPAPLTALWAFSTRAGRLIEAFTRDVVADHGFDVSEFTLVGSLWFQDPPYRSTLGQLADAVALSQPGLSRALQRAERNGNVRKVRQPEGGVADRRTVVVELTEQGHERAGRAIHELLRRLGQRLGPLDEGTTRDMAASALWMAQALKY